jgi:hypothetical protein
MEWVWTSEGTPPFSRMCGKQRTLSPMILHVWQRKELESDFSDVWQGKELADLIGYSQSTIPYQLTAVKN